MAGTGRKRLVSAAALALAAGSAVYGYDVVGNVRARNQADAACDRFLAATEQNQKRTHAWLARVFPDVAAVERDNVGGAQDLCRSVEAELVWWRINLFRAPYEPPRDAARDSRLRLALDAAGRRCPEVAGASLDASALGAKAPEDEKEKKQLADRRTLVVSATCGAFKSARSRLDDPSPRLPVWQWPGRLEEMATRAETSFSPHSHAPRR